ncbi:hypothetical protein ACHAXM_010745 [Skeletonema potamos]
MKLALITIAALLTLTGVAGRVLHLGEGTDQVTDCTNIEKPEKPTDWWNMSDEEKADAKAEMEATNSTFKQQILVCACCEGKTIQELVGVTRASDETSDENESSYDEDGSEAGSSSSQDSGTTDVNTGDTEDSLSALPEHAVAIAKASATVDGSDIQTAFLSNPAAGASFSWFLAITAFVMVGLAL